jgi:predicted Rossmann-fold nucleotide-binding protein
MEAVSSGAARAGGTVIGVTVPTLFTTRTGANPHVIDEIAADTLLDRIRILTDIADGVIVLPGSIGTAAELVITWNINHIARLHGGIRIPMVAVGSPWRRLCALLIEEAGAEAGDVTVVDTVDQAIEWMRDQPEIH